VPDVLRPHVEAILSSAQAPVPPGSARYSGAFLRIVSRRTALDGRAPGGGAWVGSRPYVFLTVPEAAYGRTLVQIFSAIGYDPEDVLNQEVGVEKVAVVFAYPDGVAVAGDGQGLPAADWDRRLYPATWDNLFDLAQRLAADPNRRVVTAGDGFVPDKLLLRSDEERKLLEAFPGDRALVRTTGYAALQQAKGPEWDYRSLLERTLAAAEHFRGDGRTKLTVAGRGKSRDGFPEFLGPNARLVNLPAVAVIGLGALQVAGP
jgi:hypothetical protein